MKLLSAMVCAAVMSAPAFAQSACEPFDVTSLDGRIIGAVDAGEAGHSIDDRRVGERPLGDADGTAIGEARWSVTLLDPDPNGQSTHNLVKMYFLLDSGTILSEGVVAPVGDIHVAETVTVPQFELVILGGTGAFKHARGVIRVFPAADGTPDELTYKVDITCT
ncbi:MAG: hypothetical protein AAFR45_09240 [Pseudomonadota bacterium]